MGVEVFRRVSGGEARDCRIKVVVGMVEDMEEEGEEAGETRPELVKFDQRLLFEMIAGVP